jgi:hypothetical protein
VTGPLLRDPVLGLLADTLDDLETVRIAMANRRGILTRQGPDADGQLRGHGLTFDNPEIVRLSVALESVRSAEHETVRSLERALRKHPLAGLQQRYRGLGAKQFARLLAAVGDPYYHDPLQRPRTLGELWAYCGFHVVHAGGHPARETQNSAAPGVAPTRRRGSPQNWSTNARRRCWLIAEALMKSGRRHDDRRGPHDPVADKYRGIYDDLRLRYAEAVHQVDCVRCGRAGTPAPAASALSDGHKHARALRGVAKEFLRDLWTESKSLHENAVRPQSDERAPRPDMQLKLAIANNSC